MSFRDEDRNLRHADSPQPGDYWHEMFSPTCLVIAVSNFSVSLLKSVVEVDKDHWTFDVSKVTTMGRREFRKWLCYETIPNKTVGDVIPKRKRWEDFRDAAENLEQSTDNSTV